MKINFKLEFCKTQEGNVFADSICLLTISFKDTVPKHDELVDVNSKFILMINVNKTKEMGINILIMKKEIIQGQVFEEIDNIQYWVVWYLRQEVQRFV